MNSDLAEVLGIAIDSFAAVLAHEVVVGGVALESRADGVAVGVVEHRGVEAAHVADARKAVVGQLDPRQVALDLTLGERHDVVDKGHGEGRHDGAGAVGEFADHEVVAHEERFFHRRGWYLVELEAVAADDDGGDEGENDGVEPLASLAVFGRRMCGGIEILEFAEAQIGDVGEGGDDSQGLLPEAVAAEALGCLDDEHEEGEYVDGGDEEIDVPFPILATYFDPQDDVVDGDEGFPGGDADLFEHKTKSDERTDDVDKCEKIVEHDCL